LGDDEDFTSGRTGVGGGQPAPVKIEATRIACAGRERIKRDEREGRSRASVQVRASRAACSNVTSGHMA
jgi:hypothetical protein